ncbi:rhodanese-related sulfurtransferase [Paraburkholderia phosphatilytica]|uniref:rhodanese-related sulfurtransferase n=1 Tax=Paraburkholderia phosphatilytica TaxID=2282883 RepID=UPI000E486B04|nr:rhodanese-related sulfurtransferase [Paraburkholderia phosphatilytica]
MSSFPLRTFADVRDALLAKREIALLDVREEDPHAQSHPLFAANLPLAKLELEAWTRLPRRSVPIVLLDAGEGFAERAAVKLVELGYSDVSLLEGGLDGWIRAGGETFRDVNVPSKAFGEFVEAQRHTPSLSAEAVDALLASGDDIVVLDARRFDEYRTMNIPGSVSVPGGELVLRARALAPDPATRVIVNCAGRTRSIIGAQSLVNAGLPNPVAALRNGTIGWTLAGQTLEHGSARQFDLSAGRDDRTLAQSRDHAHALAARAGVKRTTLDEAARWASDPSRTTYRFDVRTPAEYERAHAPGFQGAPGGQLVQETEMFAPVRGARIVLFDDDGVRANMTASWLAQMNIEAYVIGEDVPASALRETGPWRGPRPPAPAGQQTVDAPALASLLADPAHGVLVLDVTSSANHVKAHIPGAHWILRSRLRHAFDDLRALPDAKRYVLTCASSALAAYVAPELAALTGKPVQVLEGGTAAWIAAGQPVESGDTHLASPRIDRYRRPYEGTDNAREAMNAYLEWEYGLVAQLERDGTHGFFVI